MRKLAFLALSAVAAAAALVPFAFGANSSVGITLKEFKVLPTTTSVKAGNVTFKISNKGALDHELVVVKTSLNPAKLPVKNQVVTLKPLKKAGPFKGGKGGTLTVALTPGKYVLFCNVKGHYGFGQRVAFTVK